jgi:hypothetical protein
MTIKLFLLLSLCLSSFYFEPYRPIDSTVFEYQSFPISKLSFYNNLHLLENPTDSIEVGKYGERGPFQITESCWIDACEYLNYDFNTTEWSYDINVWNYPKCIIIMEAYCKRYQAHTEEEQVRCLNSGPSWKDKYSKTEHHYQKFLTIKKEQS